jgi:hypothetical protein
LRDGAIKTWVQRSISLGFSEDDVLFLDTKYLNHRIDVNDGNAATVPIMSMTQAVIDAFAIACHNRDIKHTPHAAKHTIGAERDVCPLTHEERKAWSRNMGHECERNTERHYGSISDVTVLESIDFKKTIDLRNLLVSEKPRYWMAYSMRWVTMRSDAVARWSTAENFNYQGLHRGQTGNTG